MSSVSSIRSNSFLNSEIIKKADSISVLHNKNLKNVDVAIINNANQEFIAHIIPYNTSYNQENMISSNINNEVNYDYPCVEDDQEEELSEFDTIPFEDEYSNNEINELKSFNTECCDDLNNISKNFPINNPDVRWNILRSVNFSPKTIARSKQLQETFHELLDSGKLEQKFLDHLHGKTVYLNGKKVLSDQAPDIMNAFRESVPEFQTQQLISTYVHPEVLDVAWENLFKRHPGVINRTVDNEHYTYEIDEISPEMYKVAITKITDLQPSYSGDINEIHTHGMRAAMIITANFNPEMRYSFFVQ
uniref:Uncharacterized protein yba3 n=1 Tax=Buchnera aphidicola (Cinara cedri) TaxID=261318 RepID=Q5EU88_9GAMM|nr:hypothetical protein [Buchnera aphidicola (Cinara cedri)]